MLKTSSTLNLGHLFKIAPKLKKYLWKKLKPYKSQNLSRKTKDKQVGSLVLEVGTIVVTKYNQSYGNYPSAYWEEYNRRRVAGWRFWN